MVCFLFLFLTFFVFLFIIFTWQSKNKENLIKQQIWLLFLDESSPIVTTEESALGQVDFDNVMEELSKDETDKRGK